MELDARALEQDTLLDADVCIIGAGPAGITLALELATRRYTVVLLESGGRNADEEPQHLNDGAVVGSPYHGLRRTRHRQVAGSAHLWNTTIEGAPGAKYVPLDPMDFKERTHVAHSGWPFDRGHLEPFYRRAHAVCGLGPFEYEAEYWASSERPCLRLPDGLSTRVYQCGPAHLFTQAYPEQVAASPRVQLFHHATCSGLVTDGASRVVAAAVKSRPERAFRVTARFFVLAAGAVENARLLLASCGHDRTLGNQHGWVGRCFMEHPRDYALRVKPRSPDVFHDVAFYDLHRWRESTWVIGRLALDESALRSQGYGNVSVTLLPRPRRRPWLEAIGRRLSPLGHPLFQPPATVGYGWSTTGNVSRRCDSLQVLLNIEQQPNPDNRVVLSSVRDEYGLPRAELHWRWRDEEQAALNRLRAFLADRLNAVGIGSVEVSNDVRPDPNAHHHAGTTRMSVDPRHGVADGDCRVHGTDNLYVAGASVFPTTGFANPTLTIVALAIRLADHLRVRL